MVIIADQKMELYVVGGVLIIGLVYMATKGGSASTGVSFSQANPTSVAAVMNANTQVAQAGYAAQTARDGLATSLLGLQLTTNAGVKTNASNNATTLGVAKSNNDTSLNIAKTNSAASLATVKAQAASANTIAGYNKDVALNTANNGLKSTEYVSAQQTAQAKIIGSTDTAVAGIQGKTATALGSQQESLGKYQATEAHLTADNVAVQQAQAAVQVSGNQADASKSASMWGGISGIVGGLAKAIPFSSNGLGAPGAGTSVVPFDSSGSAAPGVAEYDAVGSATAQQAADNTGPLAIPVTQTPGTSSLLSLFAGL